MCVLLYLYRISIGTLVSARVGPFEETDPSIPISRRKRQVAIGEVLRPCGKSKFMVNFYGVDPEKPMPSRTLTILSNDDIRRMSRFNGADSTPAAVPTVPTAPVPTATVRSPTTTAPASSATVPALSATVRTEAVAATAATASVLAASAPATPVRVVNPTVSPSPNLARGSTVRRSTTSSLPSSSTTRSVPVNNRWEGIRTTTGVGNKEIDHVDASTYAARLAEANMYLASLVGEQVECRISGGGTMRWVVVNEHLPENPPRSRSPMDIGFNFDAVDFGPDDEFVFAKMFLALFFKDFCLALTLMNGHIHQDRADGETNARNFTIDKFLKGLGIWVGAPCFSQKGPKLFGLGESSTDTVTINGQNFKTIVHQPNLGSVMKHYMWRIWQKYFPKIWMNPLNQYLDPWWMIRSLIDDFNDNRRVLVKASNRYCIDECMIGWRPQTTESGNLAHISYEKGKPVDLGPEFKALACALLRCHLAIELLEGALPMQEKKYSRAFGAGTATVLRLQEEWYVF